MIYKKQPWAKLYKTALWQKLRTAQLLKEPLCKYCEAQGKVKLANVVDHKRPHKGDEILFFSPDNLQSLCAPHHNSTKQAEERRGIVIGGDTQGMPIDPNHHWN